MHLHTCGSGGVPAYTHAYVQMYSERRIAEKRPKVDELLTILDVDCFVVYHYGQCDDLNLLKRRN